MFAHGGSDDDVSAANLLPLYEKLQEDHEIEGRVCRGTDRVEVRI